MSDGSEFFQSKAELNRAWAPNKRGEQKPNSKPNSRQKMGAMSDLPAQKQIDQVYVVSFELHVVHTFP